jgi:hypothetical protein
MKSVSSRGRRGLRASGLGVLLILSAGCSSKGTVSGKVMVNDQPVRRGTVTFLASGSTWVSAVPIGEDGSYTVVNAPPGPVKITVASAAPNPRAGGKLKARKGAGQEEDANTDDMPQSVRNRFNPGESGPAGPSVPKKYNKPETSELTYEVKPGKQEYDIQLK